jgi:Ca-activated chloride channel family protein
MNKMRALIIISSVTAAFAFGGCGSGDIKSPEEARRDHKQLEPSPSRGAREKSMRIEGAAGMMNYSVAGDSYDDAENFNTEEYDKINENNFKDTSQNPLSTFSIDVDTASYSNVRRYINASQLPPKDSVRIEEMVNYFDYDYAQPSGSDPFSFNTVLSDSPWNKNNKLLLVGLQGKRIDYNDLKPSNLVFLVDTSGSMFSENKLALLKKGLSILVKELGAKDRVSIVAYAGSAGLVLPATPGTQKDKIIGALESLQAGGSTAGGQGIILAYKIAKENLVTGGNNRVILCTDGDFNVGVSSTSEMVRLIEEKRKDDIYLTICGFGMGNYKDGRMEQISNAGNGNYFYIDSINEADKVFRKDMRGNMFTIAKDVKVQIEFNPVYVKGYRLVGYENRILNAEDFKDDKKDAGELGAGHRVTALYEIVPAGSPENPGKADPLKYQNTAVNKNASGSSELMTIKFRYKPIKSNSSIEIVHPVKWNPVALEKAGDNLRFASAVAGFGMVLRGSEHKGNADFDMVLKLAKSSKGKDEEGYRSEFIRMVETAKLLSSK